MGYKMMCNYCIALCRLCIHVTHTHTHGLYTRIKCLFYFLFFRFIKLLPCGWQHITGYLNVCVRLCVCLYVCTRLLYIFIYFQVAGVGDKWMSAHFAKNIMHIHFIHSFAYTFCYDLLTNFMINSKLISKNCMWI